ncbi:PBSX family phage terminase large subunit [Nocardioides zeae]
MKLGLSQKQLRSIAWATARVNLWTGSIRSGKTIASLIAWLAYVANAPRGGELVVVGRTRDSIARNVFGPLQDPTLFGHLAGLVKYTPGAPTAIILGRKVWVMGSSDVSSEKILRGLTVAGAYVDEATLVAETFWTQLLGRMSVPGARLFATTNPDGPAHWLKRQVVDRAEHLGYRVFRFRLDDNDWLLQHSPEYVAQIKREYVGLWYRRFILGEWVQAEGAVYDMWDPARHVVPAAAIPPMDRVLALGVDHGTTNPTRGLLLGLAERRLWVLDEWAPQTGLTDAVQSAGLRGWLGAREPEPRRTPEWLYVDPAAASFKMQLFHDGVTNVANAHNDVLAGIRTVGSLLATDRLVVSEQCTNLVEQLPGYSWDPKATAKGEDKPLKVADHEVDALRYAVHSPRVLWRSAIPLDTARDRAPGADEHDDGLTAA